jgi:nucleotide-binding universal stress UspA family protein
MDTNYTIVVGIDGSAASRRALRWAMREAASRGGAVKAIAAWDSTRNTLEEGTPEAHFAGMVKAEVDAVESTQGQPVRVFAEAIRGTPAEVLATAAGDANLMVIGSHGATRAWHQLMGSTAEECIRRARCPVVIVPVPHDQRN